MKLIAKSNFDLETVNDVLIAENVHKGFGEHIVRVLNKDKSDDTYFYSLVENDYELYKFEI